MNLSSVNLVSISIHPLAEETVTEWNMLLEERDKTLRKVIEKVILSKAISTVLWVHGLMHTNVKKSIIIRALYVSFLL